MMLQLSPKVSAMLAKRLPGLFGHWNEFDLIESLMNNALEEYLNNHPTLKVATREIKTTTTKTLYFIDEDVIMGD